MVSRRDMAFLTEQWESLADDARRLTGRRRMPVLTEADIQELRLDFEWHLSPNRREYQRWIENHPKELRGYGIPKLEWLDGFAELIGEMEDIDSDVPTFRVPRAVEEYPWWEWYSLLRGNPPESFPDHLNWFVCLHHLFLAKGG